MVQTAVARLVEGRGGLTGQTAHLVGGEAAALEQVRERNGSGERLLDDETDALVGADVEHPHEAKVLDAGGTPGGVQRRCRDRGRGGEADQHDLALEGVVVGAPALVVHTLRGAQRHGIAATEDGSRSDSLHLRHPPLVRPYLEAWLGIILGGSVGIPSVRTAERLVCRGECLDVGDLVDA